MHTAVLFLVFNRPDTTLKAFEAIRQARPPRLYVAADGPRPGRAGDGARCEQVRRIATSVDWPCEVRTLLREGNLGCKTAVAGGISWFFETEEEGIILEDDVVPDASFFPFCEELLERYRADSTVMMISGNCFHRPGHRPNASYFFSRYTYIWGWATWRRAWQYYDRDMTRWPSLKGTDFLRRLGGVRRSHEAHWTRVFQAAYAGQIDTWDYQWLFASMARGGLSISPSKNLATNIGFSSDGTHTTDEGGSAARIPLESIGFPLIHPSKVARDSAVDRWEDLHVFRTIVPLAQRVRMAIMRLSRLKSVPGRLLRRLTE